MEKYMSAKDLQYFRLRRRREKICFSIVNRGQIWYETLTETQKNELRSWYKNWLDVTVTLTEPTAPTWLK